MFYEAKNSQQAEQFKVEIGKDFSFPAHIHSSFELIILLDGEMQVMIDKKQYDLAPGQAVLVFPNQVHALSTPNKSEHILCIFSPQMIRAYSSAYLNHFPVSPTFEPDAFYIRQLQTLTDQTNRLQIKGFLYSVCASFNAHAQYLPRSNRDESLLGTIFRFVEDNYTGRCTLQDLADFTSYHKVYLSRYFKQYTGISYTDHVNRYRISEAAYILKNTNKKMLEVAFSCGFDSLRSFNRNFKQIMGIAPSQFLQRDS